MIKLFASSPSHGGVTTGGSLDKDLTTAKMIAWRFMIMAVVSDNIGVSLIEIYESDRRSVHCEQKNYDSPKISNIINVDKYPADNSLEEQLKYFAENVRRKRFVPIRTEYEISALRFMTSKALGYKMAIDFIRGSEITRDWLKFAGFLDRQDN